jgi:hypothetical protein
MVAHRIDVAACPVMMRTGIVAQELPRVFVLLSLIQSLSMQRR